MKFLAEDTDISFEDHPIADAVISELLCCAGQCRLVSEDDARACGLPGMHAVPPSACMPNAIYVGHKISAVQSLLVRSQHC